jgi:hypothetical protein
MIVILLWFFVLAVFVFVVAFMFAAQGASRTLCGTRLFKFTRRMK